MTSSVLRIPGPVAENKDWARDKRESWLLPKVQAGRSFALDFRAVETATQSFIHALVSSAVAEGGAAVLDYIEFRGCGPQVREAVEAVIEYSLRAHQLSRESESGELETRDVPQANSLWMVRVVVDSLASGDTTPNDVVATTGFSLRQVHYCLHAARVLGLALFGRNLATVTQRGITLSRSRRGGADELMLLRRAIIESSPMQVLAPNLLVGRAPDPAKLAFRLRRLTGLSPVTARRRAKTLLAWRQVVAQQRMLF